MKLFKITTLLLSFCIIEYGEFFMISYFHRRHDKKVDLKEFERSTVSTLLIPKHLVEKLELVIPFVENSKTKKKSYKFKEGLKKLLEKYRGLLARGYLPFQHKPKLTYQEEGLDLQKFCFRPEDADWFELGILAYGCGVSRCWLFSFLVELDLSLLADFVDIGKAIFGVTSADLSRPRLIQQVFGKRRFIHRILHFRL
jgi:hypothetical protein